MTLYEHMQLNENGAEITVHDVDYDIESYFYNDLPKDKWQEAMLTIAKKLLVVETDDDEVVTVNLSEVIGRNLDNGKFEKLFIRNDVDHIMDDIEAIFSGYVSEEWLTEFANSLI